MAIDIDPCRETKKLENEKFATNSDGKTIVRVEDESLGGLLRGVIYDAVSVAYPLATTEVYSFFNGGLGGTLVATITLVYTNASKSDLTSVVKT